MPEDDPEVKSKRGEHLRNWIDFIFGFENKRGEELDYWISFSDSFSYPPQDFYAAIEKELAARKFPQMEVSREVFSEGGLMSDNRIYLRMFRERLALYMCAAPFGTGYFFSCRAMYVPALVRLWHILAALGFLCEAARLSVEPLGVVFTVVAVVTFVFALGMVLSNAASAALSDFDAVLLRIPILATFYENWFREDTFYRIDTRVLYLKQVPEIVNRLAEDITAANGARLVRQRGPAPLLRNVHKGPETAKKPQEA